MKRMDHPKLIAVLELWNGTKILLEASETPGNIGRWMRSPTGELTNCGVYELNDAGTAIEDFEEHAQALIREAAYDVFNEINAAPSDGPDSDNDMV